jgi:hypothetical protein
MDNRIPGYPSADLRSPDYSNPIRPFTGFEGPRRYQEAFNGSATVRLDVEPGGLLEFDGFPQGWTIQDGNSRIAYPIGAGDFWACPSSKLVTLTPGASPTTIKVTEWPYEMGKIRAMARAGKAANNITVVNALGGKIFPTGQTFDKIALGAEADYIIPAGTIQATFLAPGAVDAAPVR